MMKYPHIMAALCDERWAIEESKLRMILDFMADQSSGTKYEAAEVAARIGGGRDDRGGASKVGGVAIIPLRGVISNRMSMMTSISGGTSTEGFGAAFKKLVADDAVKAIVIDVDSPGGAVMGTDELSSIIFSSRGRKPIVAHVNATAASAAYWIATAADEIVVTPSGVVGSIGVLMVHDDMSGALEKAGIRKTIISAGERKTSGNPYSALPDDVRARIQSRIDAAYGTFVRAVARNRGVDAETVRERFGQGEVVDAPVAVSLGMADRLGTLDETIDRLVKSKFTVAPRARRSAPAREQRALALRHESFEAMRQQLSEPPVLLRLSGMATAFHQVADLEGSGPTEYLPSCFGVIDPVALLRDHEFAAPLTPPDGVSFTKMAAGLMMNCDIRADRFGLAVLAAWRAGLKSMSIGSDIQDASTSFRDGKLVKRVTRAKVREVSLVRRGAFSGTEARLQPVGGLSLAEAIRAVDQTAVRG